MNSYEDEIGLLADDIKRWAGQDARIHDALEKLLRLHQSQVDALSFEARTLDKLVTEATLFDERAS